MIAPTPSGKSTGKSASWFRTADGKNYAFIFLLVSSLFLLWGTCNGMIDVLNKHFQDSLHLTKAESAFVQFANYMGYFFMAIPSGLLAIRFGYKGAIIIGLTLVALGSFWFIPATHVDALNTYWSFLLGLFILATGLTCLETVCNPYTTVLGPPESGAARINLAQSANGIGWMIGPVLGGFFVLSATGEPITSNADLFKPYLIVALIVTVIAVIFVINKVPDLHNVEESKTASAGGAVSVKPLWKRSHFIFAVAAQFFYVAAQTGVFSFFVNYMATDSPALTQNGADRLQAYDRGIHFVFRIPVQQMTYPAAMFSAGDLVNVSDLVNKLQNDADPKTKPVSQFIWSDFSSNTNYAGFATASAGDQKGMLVKGLNQILRTNTLFAAVRSGNTVLPDEQRKLVDSNVTGEELVRANRTFLEDTYASTLIARSPYTSAPWFRITDVGSGVLLGFGGFALFLLGRITGSLALRSVKPQLMLALYSLANVVMMVLVMNTWGWLSVTGLFLSFFFMSITYPTIFSLGIHGLGEKTKLGSSFIVQAIVGGAIMPLWMGWLADHYGMRIGFLMPLLCFVLIAAYGMLWEKFEAKDRK